MLKLKAENVSNGKVQQTCGVYIKYITFTT